MRSNYMKRNYSHLMWVRSQGPTGRISPESFRSLELCIWKAWTSELALMLTSKTWTAWLKLRMNRASSLAITARAINQWVLFCIQSSMTTSSTRQILKSNMNFSDGAKLLQTPGCSNVTLHRSRVTSQAYVTVRASTSYLFYLWRIFKAQAP